jgi:hypothetical protein
MSRAAAPKRIKTADTGFRSVNSRHLAPTRRGSAAIAARQWRRVGLWPYEGRGNVDGSPEMGRLRLGDTDWTVWQECELRTAGFPAFLIEPLCTAELGRFDPDSPSFESCYDLAVERQSIALRRLAARPDFREAVAWQNPTMLRACVDKVATASPARGPIRRRRELKVASYLQRYAMKNDTIGFFGPVGWARWSLGHSAVRARPGNHLLAGRRVYFERWAVAAMADALCDKLPLRPWLRPRRSAANLVVENRVHRPRGAPVELTSVESRLLAMCDGTRTTVQIAARLTDATAESVYAALDRLQRAGLVTLDLGLSIVDEESILTAPEQRLRSALLEIGDPELRDPAVRAVDEILHVRDEVAAAAGDPDRLVAALTWLDGTFEQLTGQPARRRGGEFYAGRTLVYEDTVRDIDVELGRPLLDALAAPLGLVLDSARWFVGFVAEAYRRRFREIFEAYQARTGSTTVPFAALLRAATPDLVFSFRDLATPVADQLPELRRRWASILDIPSGVHRHTVRSEAIAGRVRELFPSMPPPWSSAVQYCPDVMVAAPSVAAVNSGDFLLVLGELHLATNTLDCQVVVQQHPDPRRLGLADARDHGGLRVVPVPASASSEVNSRTYPPAMMRPDYLYWTLHTANTGAPGPVVPGAGMVVSAHGDRLVVRMPGDGRTIDLLEVVGEYLSAAVMNAFQPVPVLGHRPRVAVDRLVICREAWSFRIDELTWSSARTAAERFRSAQRWRRAEGLPGRAFYRIGTEDKPVLVDFTSPVLVELLASLVRGAVADGQSPTLSLSEVLPDVGQHWLCDADGAAYSSELRLVAVDERAVRR